MGDKRSTVMKVWKCTITEEWDEEPAYRIFVPPDTDTKEVERFLIENNHEDGGTVDPPFWLNDQPDEPEAAVPGDDDLVLERDSEGHLRVKED